MASLTFRLIRTFNLFLLVSGRRRREIDRRKTTHDKVNELHIPLSSECRRILQHASEEADRLHHERISTGHFLLGFLLEKDSFATSMLMNIFSEKGIRTEKVQASIVEFLNEAPI